MSNFRWTTTDAPERRPALFDAVVERKAGRGAYRGLEFLHVESRSLINRVPPGRFPFEYTINAYRGCSHACTYCFARPTHDYLGLGIGGDFDTKIVVKVNAPEVLRRETEPGRWAGHPIAMGTNTDPYQPAEGKYKLTQGIIEVLAERRNPFSILTKSPLVLRDLDLLAETARTTEVSVNFSVGTLDSDVWSRSEPGTAHPRKRLEAVRRLNDRGVPSGVLMAPVLPGLSDRPDQIEAVMEAAAEAGAEFTAGVLLHLRGPLKEHYFRWLEAEYPRLLRFYRHTYGKRSYAPPAMRRRLGRLIRRFAAARGGPAPERSRRSEPPGGGADGSGGPDAAPARLPEGRQQPALFR